MERRCSFGDGGKGIEWRAIWTETGKEWRKATA